MESKSGTTSVCIRLDKDIKSQFEEMCNQMGLSMSAAFNIFARQTIIEQRIPFVITAKDKSSIQ